MSQNANNLRNLETCHIKLGHSFVCVCVVFAEMDLSCPSRVEAVGEVVCVPVCCNWGRKKLLHMKSHFVITTDDDGFSCKSHSK